MLRYMREFNKTRRVLLTTFMKCNTTEKHLKLAMFPKLSRFNEQVDAQ